MQLTFQMFKLKGCVRIYCAQKVFLHLKSIITLLIPGKNCSINNYTDLPCSPIIVALYLSELLNSTKSYQSASSAFYGIKWAHQINGLLDPTDNNFVKNILESAKRTAKKPCQKKDPVTSDLIIELCDSFSQSEDLCTVRSLCMITTAFSGFFF